MRKAGGRSGKVIVKKWTTVEKTLTDGGRTVSLDEHDGSYAIRVDGATLMSTRQHESEEQLAEFACAHLKGRARARVLIGGLGFGYTLKAALAVLAPDAAVVVAEILAAVIAWNRDPSLPLAADAMNDPRVTVLHQDVREVMREARRGFDSIMLDVDNGPAALTADQNSGVYDYTGLQWALAALRPEGCAAFWCAAPDQTFERLMARAGFKVETRRCRSRPGAGQWHTLYLGRAK